MGAGEPLFANAGEVGTAMAARDWDDSAVGEPSTWPSTLRNAVRTMLTSRFSMWAAWGPDLTFFYNDAYRRDTLQAKHPWALGRPAQEVWAEIWPDIGPRIQSVLDTGIATWDENLLLFLERSDYSEETYHTFSYSPLGGEDGGAEGMLCVVAETTQRVVGERRMATLRDLAAAVATTRTETDLLAAVADQLGRNTADLPFSLTYLFDESGNVRLACASGMEGGGAAAPSAIDAGEADPAWPLAELRAGREALVDNLSDRFPGLPTGNWQHPPVEAVAVPFATSAQGHGPTAGFLVVGLNPHRRYDDAYRGFVELVANQIASGLVNARSYEAERRRAESLAELDRAKTDFFSNVSHEFRTPLTLIMGPLAELQNSSALAGDARAREELDVIERNALRLGKLVNTLLDFSRLQAGRIDARFEPVDLAVATAELASVFRSAVERAGLRFTVDCPPLDEPVFVDRDMWEKVVLNLLSNAVKFTFEGGITVALRRDGDRAVLTVADTGTGVPADELPRLFERFHRIERARSRSGEGSGIGLAMVRELVGLHGGSITAESEPDAGTTFTVAVPLGSEHLPPEQVAWDTNGAGVSTAAEPFVAEALRWLPGDHPGQDEPDSTTTVPLVAVDRDPLVSTPGRVLIADDNADMREYLQRLLAPRYAVEVVSDGQAALTAALASPPDLVLSDVMMPGLDGMALLTALRSDERTARVPVVLLSARAGQEAAVEGLAAGADDYLVKPFSARELMARVGAHVELGRVRRESEERFRAMADLAPALIWVADAGGQRVFLNAGWQEFTGREMSADLGDRWQAALHPDDRERYLEVVADAAASHRPWEIEYRLRRDDGAFHWLLERAVPIGGGDGAAGYVGSCTDINARYRESQRQSLLAAVGAALDRETEVSQQLTGLARLTVDSRLADLCTVRLVGDDGRLRVVGAAGPDAATEAELATLTPETGIGPDVAATGEALVLPDAVASVPGGLPGDDVLVDRLGVRSRLAVPLRVRGRVLAVLGLGRRADAPPYNDDDRVLLEEIADRAALALDNALLLVDERASAHRLALLQRATAELSAATTPVLVASSAATHLSQLLGKGCEVGVFELDEHKRTLVALTQTGTDEDVRARWSSVSLTVSRPLTAAVEERRAQWLDDVGEPDAPAGGVALPLVAGGRAVGVIGIALAPGRRITSTERATLLALAEQCAQALDRARLYRAERRIAETLQRSLLPQRLPRVDRLALAARYLPGAEGTQAGGDWYDVVELDGNRVAIAVGDVVGQGPAAAAVMGQLRSALSTALLSGCGPAEALELLDRFATRLPGATASTAACLIVDPAEGSIRWARAGHPPPLLLADGEARFLDTAGSGTVLGVSTRHPYAEGTASVAPGSVLVLYTDGLVERRDEVLDRGLGRLADAVRRHGDASPDRLVTLLLRESLADTDQPDDVALIAVRLVPEPLERRIPADSRRLAEVRRAVEAWAQDAALTTQTLEDLQLALGEAVANAVEHAYRDRTPGECAFRVAWQPGGDLEVTVRDSGTWRPPPDDPGFRGRGLALMHSLGQDVRVEPSAGGGTTVRFRVAAERTDATESPDGAVPVGVVSRDDGHGDAVARLTTHRSPTDGLVLEIAGELDLESAGALRQELLDALAALGDGAATIDLRRTTYLASAGVGLLLESDARARAAGTALRVQVLPDSAPARLLGVSGLDSLLTVEPAGHPDA